MDRNVNKLKGGEALWIYLLSSGNVRNRRITVKSIFFLLLLCFFLIYVRNEGGLLLAITSSWNGRISNVKEKNPEEDY